MSVMFRPVSSRFLARLSGVSGVAWRTMSGGKPEGERLCKYQYETLEVSQSSDFVTKVMMNRPHKNNAMNSAFWREIKDCFNKLDSDPDCRVVLLTGAGKHFTAGLDLMDFASQLMPASLDEGGARDVARRFMAMRRLAQPMQESFTAVEKCVKPVLAVIHGACIGGGVDLISSCDVRIASNDAYFQIKEVDVGLCADVGTLQRLPKLVGGASLLRELVYTARKFSAQEALGIGMLSGVHSDRESAESAGLDLAKVIASKSPVAVQGSKVNLNFSRDHPVDVALDYALVWNSAMLQSEDLLKAAQANMNKETAVFSKL